MALPGVPSLPAMEDCAHSLQKSPTSHTATESQACRPVLGVGVGGRQRPLTSQCRRDHEESKATAWDCPTPAVTHPRTEHVSVPHVGLAPGTVSQ